MNIGKTIYHKQECESSFEWAASGIEHEADGTVYVCDVIRQCRGRQDRSWTVLEGQLLITILLKPNFENTPGASLEQKLCYLSMALGLGMLEPLKRFGTHLKWPNDFLINEKKLGGMLTRIHWGDSTPKAVIFGIGLNINSNIEAHPMLAPFATSLARETKKLSDKNTLLLELLESASLWYEKWNKGAFAEIYAAWRSAQTMLGKPIRVHTTQKTILEGVVSNFFENGDIEIKTGAQSTRLSFHEIFDVLP
jgi:BirA family biotin operon repressor/biotin-[acetyl-CoA-carboxylase] ligase